VEDLSLHILDIVENSIRAKASRVDITVIEDVKRDLLVIEIKDNGKGMDKVTIRKVLDPFFTTKGTGRVGLGLPLLQQSARETGGDLEVKSKLGKGTCVKAFFKLSHIDLRPMGNIVATLKTLIIGNPGVDFTYKYKKDKLEQYLDTREIRSGIKYNQAG
jgi:anti-sigma regulatory factor (Ser/Thr protein kinase)